jgi:hypothetical protein
VIDGAIYDTFPGLRCRVESIYRITPIQKTA